MPDAAMRDPKCLPHLCGREVGRADPFCTEPNIEVRDEERRDDVVLGDRRQQRLTAATEPARPRGAWLNMMADC